MTTRQRLAVHFLKDFSKPIPFRYIPDCEKAIHNMETDRAGEEIRLCDGLVRTSGDVLRMFALEEYVNWYKASFEHVKARDNRRAVGCA